MDDIIKEKEYLWAADGEDGLIELILDLNEMVVHLQGRLVQVLRKQERSAQSLTQNLREPVEDLEQKGKGTSQIKLKFPRLNLPMFNGNILYWQEFWNVFNSRARSYKIQLFEGFLKRNSCYCNIWHFYYINDNYSIAIYRYLKNCEKEVIIKTLYSQLQHISMATN